MNKMPYHLYYCCSEEGCKQTFQMSGKPQASLQRIVQEMSRGATPRALALQALEALVEGKRKPLSLEKVS